LFMPDTQRKKHVRSADVGVGAGVQRGWGVSVMAPGLVHHRQEGHTLGTVLSNGLVGGAAQRRTGRGRRCVLLDRLGDGHVLQARRGECTHTDTHTHAQANVMR
jgi:hypothetical protein